MAVPDFSSQPPALGQTVTQLAVPGLGGLPSQDSQNHGHGMPCPYRITGGKRRPYGLNTGRVAMICEASRTAGLCSTVAGQR